MAHSHVLLGAGTAPSLPVVRRIGLADLKDALAKGTFYKDLRAKFGDEAWKLLQDSVGNLG